MDNNKTAPAGSPQRQLFDISDLGLKCADCGKEITELPFQPNPDQPVFCFDCKKQRKTNFLKKREIS